MLWLDAPPGHSGLTDIPCLAREFHAFPSTRRAVPWLRPLTDRGCLGWPCMIKLSILSQPGSAADIISASWPCHGEKIGGEAAGLNLVVPISGHLRDLDVPGQV